MNKLVQMRYKDFTFSQNPESIKITAGAAIAEQGVLGKAAQTHNVFKRVQIISGSGRFYGSDAVKSAKRLLIMAGDRNPGILIAPGMPPMEAYFEKYQYEISSKEHCILYSFEFLQSSTKEATMPPFDTTCAKQGENAFDIAYRCDVSVDDIIVLNGLQTPFDIEPLSEVKIR